MNSKLPANASGGKPKSNAGRKTTRQERLELQDKAFHAWTSGHQPAAISKMIRTDARGIQVGTDIIYKLLSEKMEQIREDRYNLGHEDYMRFEGEQLLILAEAHRQYGYMNAMFQRELRRFDQSMERWEMERMRRMAETPPRAMDEDPPKVPRVNAIGISSILAVAQKASESIARANGTLINRVGGSDGGPITIHQGPLGEDDAQRMLEEIDRRTERFKRAQYLLQNPDQLEAEMRQGTPMQFDVIENEPDDDSPA